MQGLQEKNRQVYILPFLLETDLTLFIPFFLLPLSLHIFCILGHCPGIKVTELCLIM